MAKKQVNQTFEPLRRGMECANGSNDNMLDRATDQHAMEIAKAKRQHKAETQLAREKAAPLMEKGGKKKEAAVQAAYAELKANTAETESQRKHATAELEQWKVKKAAEIKQKYEAELSNIGVKKST